MQNRSEGFTVDFFGALSMLFFLGGGGQNFTPENLRKNPQKQMIYRDTRIDNIDNIDIYHIIILRYIYIYCEKYIDK